jgi:DME family drug/metabolite transporter
VLYSRALTVVPVATATTLALMEPVVATLLGVLVVGERLTPTTFAGILLVLCGLLFLTVNVGRKTPLPVHQNLAHKTE